LGTKYPKHTTTKPQEEKYQGLYTNFVLGFS